MPAGEAELRSTDRNRIARPFRSLPGDAEGWDGPIPQKSGLETLVAVYGASYTKNHIHKRTIKKNEFVTPLF
jgi:hypothetical protein